MLPKYDDNGRIIRPQPYYDRLVLKAVTPVKKPWLRYVLNTLVVLAYAFVFALIITDW